jgi:EAL domain-containing protein (putative c-di-GMP-specific phosphodiesterase class I)
LGDDGLGTDQKDEGIVRAVIDLARTLGLEVVAEGLETGEQLAHLREMKCELVQIGRASCRERV